jgi:putative membrane protein
MKPDPRRTLRSLAVAGALLIAVPAPTYAQDIAASLTTPPFVVQQDDNDTVSGTEQGSGGGGVLIVAGPQPFLRTAVSGSATDMEAARLALERSEDPAVKQFAALILRQSQMMMEDASRAASTAGVGARQAPTDDDEMALIDDLKTLSGREFDETYLRAFIQDHRTTVAEYMAARQGMNDGEMEPAAAYADRHLGLMLDQLRSATELAMRLGIEVE